jgi:hypothetical protein
MILLAKPPPSLGPNMSKISFTQLHFPTRVKHEYMRSALRSIFVKIGTQPNQSNHKNRERGAPNPKHSRCELIRSHAKTMMMMKTTGMPRLLSPSLAVSYRSTRRSIGHRCMELLAVLLLLLSSSSMVHHHPAGVAAQPTEELLDAQLAFTDIIVDDLYNATTTKNQCTSALGLSMMLSLLYPAMSDDAQLEAQEVFGFPPLDDDDATGQLVWAEFTEDINTRYDGACLPAPADGEECSFGANPLVSIANSVWTQTGRVLNGTYAAVVRDDANITKEIDFVSQEAGKTINTWVNDTTRGVIDKLFGKWSM